MTTSNTENPQSTGSACMSMDAGGKTKQQASEKKEREVMTLGNLTAAHEA